MVNTKLNTNKLNVLKIFRLFAKIILQNDGRFKFGKVYISDHAPSHLYFAIWTSDLVYMYHVYIFFLLVVILNTLKSEKLLASLINIGNRNMHHIKIQIGHLFIIYCEPRPNKNCESLNICSFLVSVSLFTNFGMVYISSLYLWMSSIYCRFE